MGSERTAAAYAELLDALRELETSTLSHPAVAGDEQTEVEAYKWILSVTQVAFDCFVWADAARPRFVDIVGPYKKWGGDNPDAYYQYAPIDPARSYRVTGRRGDAVYLSLSVYGGPDNGDWSDRIVGIVNDRDLAIGDDGRFEMWLSPEPPSEPGTAWIRLEPDAVCAVTRDYLADPVHGARASFRIEAVDPPGSRPTYREEDARLAVGLDNALRFIRGQRTIAPLDPGAPNTVDPPYPVPTVTFGWAAGDAAYAMGTFDLDEDRALVLRGTSPACAFWNLVLWNPFLHSYNADYDRVSINGEQVAYEPDGSWTIVVAPRDPGHANWVSTQGHRRGRLWFRWFFPEATPDDIDVVVVPVDEVGATVGSVP